MRSVDGFRAASIGRRRLAVSAADREYVERVRRNKARARAEMQREQRLAREPMRVANERLIAERELTLMSDLGLTARDMERIAQGAAAGRAETRRRAAARKRATPAWADEAAIREFYVEAARRELRTGIRHDVDHIVPINSPVVCGLHCEDNLQVMTKYANIKKSNRVWPDMP